jgi:hypothetical protein
MSKIVIAVTNIKHNGVRYLANEPIPVEEFTKAQIESLYDAGAIKIQEVADASEEKPEDSVEKPKETGSSPKADETQTSVGSSESGAAKPPTPAKATTIKADKSSGKSTDK